MSDLLVSPARVKRYALARAPALKHHKFTRVGSDVVEHADLLVRSAIDRLILAHPSMGKTISLGTRSRGSATKEDDG